LYQNDNQQQFIQLSKIQRAKEDVNNFMMNSRNSEKADEIFNEVKRYEDDLDHVESKSNEDFNPMSSNVFNQNLYEKNIEDSKGSEIEQGTAKLGNMLS